MIFQQEYCCGVFAFRIGVFMHTSIISEDRAVNEKKPVIGVWHRPNSSERETSLEQLCRLLDDFKSAGINMVFLETFYHGMSVFKTEMIPYNTDFEKFSYGEYPDYVTAFAVEAKKRGITVHAWMQDFYVGVEEDNPFVRDHMDWMLINQAGSIRHTTEGHGFGGYLFLDPSNAEARNYLVKFYDQLLTEVPEIGGLNLDYIRYPISIFEEDTDTGYTETSMREFSERYGLLLSKDNMREDLNLKIKENNLINEWVAHRSEYITSFIRQVREMVDNNHKGRLISTAVFPEIELTYQIKKQNIKAWVDNKYIDMVTPMVYSYEAHQVFESVKKLKALCGDINCYTGLYTTYHNQSVTELAEHIKASADAGAEGFILFDAAKTFFEAKEDYMSFLSKEFGNKK